MYWSRIVTLLSVAFLAVLCLPNAFAESDSPERIDLTGVVRDFRERTAYDGHPDFERKPDHGFGLYSGNVSTELGEDGNPVYVGSGRQVKSPYRDADGRTICHALYDEQLGDEAGILGWDDDGGIESAESFAQWYSDALGVNMSSPLTLTFVRQPGGSYVFDDKQDPDYRDLGGFFPVDDELLGNPGGTPDHNFHFTFELHARFTYDADGNQFFKFTGDDDVWVFIDDRLVIDLGGVHSAEDQYVDLTRLGLVDGEVYAIDFFFAERHRTQSNFRIETTLELESEPLPTITAIFD
ncbi:MAG: fibro-slime domain-containing protein [Planctomycetota bacterium]|jgi:fibro-slime domain-containing protein